MLNRPMADKHLDLPAEMEIEYDKFVNWLDHFGLQIFHIHCSGHIMSTEMRQTMGKIAPRKSYPIHTEHLGLFARFVSGLTDLELPVKNKMQKISA